MSNDILNIKRSCVVNRTMCIDTLEAKARAMGYLWQEPEAGSLGRFDVNGGIDVRSLVSITDVDGIVKKTLKTEFLDGAGEQRKKPAIGISDGSGWVFHGRLSCNWTPAVLSPVEILAELGRGHSITPGKFRMEPGLSRRSAKSLESVSFLLMDGDAWSDACPPPLSIGELLSRFPRLSEDVFWIGESISSRSELKPEMRFRLMVLLPEPLATRRDAAEAFVSQRDRVGKQTFDVIIKRLISRYPFLAAGPSKDAVRLAYGNARADIREQVLGGMLSETFVAECLAAARDELNEQDAAEKVQAQKAAKRLSFAKAAGAVSESCPFESFHREDVRSLLESHGFSFLRSAGGQDEYNFHESGQGRSCAVSGAVLKPFSHSLVACTPDMSPEPVNVYRLVCWMRYQVDIKGIAGPAMDALKKRLAEDGWGTYQERGRRRQVARVLSKSADRVPVVVRELEQVRRVLDKHIGEILSDDVPAGGQAFYHVGADTGVGKTRAVLLNTASSLYVAPHGDLVDGAFAEAVLLGRDAFRWRSRWWGFKDLYEDCNGDRALMEDRAFETVREGVRALCPYADMAEAVVRSGRLPGNKMCLTCPLREPCQARGYLSQYAVAASASGVFIALPEMQLVLDRDWEGMADRLVKDRIAIIDDAAVWDLVVRRSLSLPRVREMQVVRSEAWAKQVIKEDGQDAIRFEPAVSAAFLKQVIDELSAKPDRRGFYFAMRGIISDFQERKVWVRVLWELHRSPLYVSFHRLPGAGDEWQARSAHDGRVFPIAQRGVEPVFGELPEGILQRQRGLHRVWLTDNELMRAGIAGYESMKTVQAFPEVADINTGWAASLARFVGEVWDSENAPCGFNAENGEGEWFLSPSLNFQKTVYLSATADAMVLSSLLPASVRFKSYPGEPVQWEEGCAVYQLSTGRMTEESFFKREGGEISGPGPRLQDVVNLVLQQVALGDRVLLVGRKALQDAESLSEVMGPVRGHEQVVIVNYGEIVGRNDLADCDIVILMLPEPPPVELERVASVVYRNDAKPLSFEREQGEATRCGLLYKGAIFKDARVERVYISLVHQKMYQAAMRLRPGLQGNKHIVLLTSLPVRGLSDRAGIRLFGWAEALGEGDIRDIGVVNDVNDVKDVKTDVDILLDAGGSVASVARSLGISEHTVRKRRTVDPKAQKRQRDERIRAGAAAGMTMRDIAKEEGVSLGTISNVLSRA